MGYAKIRTQHRKWQQLINEFRETELSYFKQLVECLAFYQHPLQQALHASTVAEAKNGTSSSEKERAAEYLSAHEIKDVFSNMGAILVVTSFFLMRLASSDASRKGRSGRKSTGGSKGRKSTSSSSKGGKHTQYSNFISMRQLSESLEDVLPLLTVYHPYVNNHHNALQVLSESLSRLPNLEKFLNSRSNDIKMNLQSYLITPIQRMPRCKLMLDGMVDCGNKLQDAAHKFTSQQRRFLFGATAGLLQEQERLVALRGRVMILCTHLNSGEARASSVQQLLQYQMQLPAEVSTKMSLVAGHRRVQTTITCRGHELTNQPSTGHSSTEQKPHHKSRTRSTEFEGPGVDLHAFDEADLAPPAEEVPAPVSYGRKRAITVGTQGVLPQRMEASTSKGVFRGRNRGSVESRASPAMRATQSFRMDSDHGGNPSSPRGTAAAAFALAAGQRADKYQRLMVVACNDSIIIIGQFSHEDVGKKHHQLSAGPSATSAERRLSFCTMSTSDAMLLPITGLKIVADIPGQPLLVWVASKCALVYKHGNSGGSGTPKFGKMRKRADKDKKPGLRKRSSQKDMLKRGRSSTGSGAGGAFSDDDGDEYEVEDIELCFLSAYEKKTFVDCVENGQRHVKEMLLQQSNMAGAGSPRQRSSLSTLSTPNMMDLMMQAKEIKHQIATMTLQSMVLEGEIVKQIRNLIMKCAIVEKEREGKKIFFSHWDRMKRSVLDLNEDFVKMQNEISGLLTRHDQMTFMRFLHTVSTGSAAESKDTITYDDTFGGGGNATLGEFSNPMLEAAKGKTKGVASPMRGRSPSQGIFVRCVFHSQLVPSLHTSWCIIFTIVCSPCYSRHGISAIV
jgi:hypothetical protein